MSEILLEKLEAEMKIKPEKVALTLENFIREYTEKLDREGIVLGLSELARYLNIPARIIEKPPSPDLIPGLVDEEALGISYKKMDLILLALEKGWSVSDIVRTLVVEEDRVRDIKKMIHKSEHMRRIYTP